MKAVLAIPLALVPLSIAALAPRPAPAPELPPAPMPLTQRWDPAHPANRASSEVVDSEAPIPTERPIPHWPADWPSPNTIHPGESAAGTQTMGSGDVDVFLDAGAGFQVADVPAPATGPTDDGAADDADTDDDQDDADTDDDQDDADTDDADENGIPDDDDADLERLGQMMRDRWEGDDEEGDEGADPFGEDPPAPPDEGTGDEEAPTGEATPAEQSVTPGYRFATPDGQPVERVLLGQEFVFEFLVREAEDPGTKTLDVTFRSANGDEETVTLERDDEGSPEGTVRYVTPKPISIAGEAGNIDYPGTVEGLDLDLGGDPEASQIIQIESVPDVIGGFTTLRVFGNTVGAGIAEVGHSLDLVEDYLQREREVTQQLLRDAEAQGLQELVAEFRQTLTRIDHQLVVLHKARDLLQNAPLPIYKFRLAKWLLDSLIERGPNGWEVKRTIPGFLTSGYIQSPEEMLAPERKRLDEQYGTYGKIVPHAAMDVISGYVVGMYSTFAHVTMAAPVITLFTGQDEFGEEASRGWALVEIGIGVVALKLPSKVIDYLAEGRLVPSVDIRVPGLGRGQPTGAPIPPRPGPLAGRAGRDMPSPGAPRATPRPSRPAPAPDVVAPDGRVLGRAGVETAGGRLAYPGRGGRRGLSADDVRQWRQRENPTDPDIITDFNEKIGQMDEAVATARQRGVPDEVINDVLTQAREQPSLGAAEPFVTGRLEWEIAVRNRERIFASAAEKQELSFNSSMPDAAATAQHLETVTVIDKVTLENVVAKSQLEASGKPQVWTAEEIEAGRSIVRRLEAGEDVYQWKTVDLDEGPGLRPLFASDDLGAIRATFTSRPLRITTETPAATPSRTGVGRPPANAAAVAEDGVRTQVRPPAPTERMTPAEAAAAVEDITPTQRGVPADDVTPTQRGVPADDATPTQRGVPADDVTPTQRGVPADDVTPTQRGVPADDATPTQRVSPLGTGEQYQGLVSRQKAGEAIRFVDFALPTVARIYGGRIDLALGARRWEQTPPDGWIDVFVPADAQLPSGVEVQVIETNVPAEVVRQASLLDTPDEPALHPAYINILVRDAPLWNRVLLRSGDVQPSSKVQDEIDERLDLLRFERVDTDALTRAVQHLSPAERLAVLRDPAARAHAIESGQAQAPATTSAPDLVDPALDPTAVGGPSGNGATSPIEVVIRSTGGSTGPVIEMFIVNHGKPLNLQTEGLVLEPLTDVDPATRARANAIVTAGDSGQRLAPPRSNLRGSGPPPLESTVVRTDVDAYCLELAQAVPTTGTLFRIASRPAQQAHGPLRAILAASRALRDIGALHPDSDPTEYFHSIRQWAIWVEENRFDQAGFERAFVDHVRKNFEAAGQTWSNEVEAQVRGFAPNRWNDVAAILEGAGRPVDH